MSASVAYVLDFEPADDSILLSSKVFTQAGPKGVLAAARLYQGAAAHDSNDRIIYDPATGALSYDDDGNGPHAPVVFAAVYPPESALTFADFVII